MYVYVSFCCQNLPKDGALAANFTLLQHQQSPIFVNEVSTTLIFGTVKWRDGRLTAG